MEDAVEGAKILSALGIGGGSCIPSIWPREAGWRSNMKEGAPSSRSAGIYRLGGGVFLAVVRPDMVIHRIAGRIPEEFSAAAGGMSWWKIRDGIEARMRERDIPRAANAIIWTEGGLRQAGFEEQQE